MAVKALRFRCMLAVGMNYNRSPDKGDAGKEMLMGWMTGCVISQMPSDWPDIKKAREELARHYEEARRLDPTLTDKDLPVPP